MAVFEDFVGEQVLAGCSILGLYPPTDPQAKEDFEAWRKVKKRRGPASPANLSHARKRKASTTRENAGEGCRLLG